MSKHNGITYTDKYEDATFEYRHVMLPKSLAKMVPEELMTEDKWRSLGVQQSPGWEHYMKHDPEPHILLFRRPLPVSTSQVAASLAAINV
jgi:cyclin-dependent kinase regulatory subunit CKS1